jgi:probable HAF family extracellular repeat protein
MKELRLLMPVALLCAFAAMSNADTIDCNVPENTEVKGTICELPSLQDTFFSVALGISPDARFITGLLLEPLKLRGYILDVSHQNADSILLRPLDNDQLTVAYNLSADGTVLAGQSGALRRQQAVVWRRRDGGYDVYGLGHLEGGGSFSIARSVNSDGTVVVGESDSADGVRAFRWVDDQMENLGTLEDGVFSRAWSVNADGTVVVGESHSADGDRAFRWVRNTGMQSLGVLRGGEFSKAYSVNSSGTVIVGESDSKDGVRAFRWVQGQGMENLGTLEDGDFSRAWSVNSDGTVSDSADGVRAFRWVRNTGMQSLGVLEGGTN